MPIDPPAHPFALIIDDDKRVREMAHLKLSRHGWTVREAPNGRAALALARESSPDLILVDMMMPEMSGIEFCRELIEELGLSDVPVLLVSGINDRAQIIKDFWSLPLRYRDFLPKPFNTEQLMEAVQKITPRLKPQSRPAAASASPAIPASPSIHASPALQKAHESHVEHVSHATHVSHASHVSSMSPSPTPAPYSSAPQPPPAKPAASAPPAPAAPPAPKFRILVIDDDDDIRSIMEMGLGMFHEVQTAENGMEGLQAFERFRPDFIILDYNMPVMNGLETAQAIRRHPHHPRVPIFFLTGEGDKSLARKVYDVGGNLYLRKPLDPMQLLKYLDHFVKETGLKPGQVGRGGEASPAGAYASAAAPAPRTAQAVRLLIVDFNIETQRLVKRLLGEEGESRVRIPGGPFETIYTEEPHAALGNLARWEPDVILYNPRNPHLDGIGFGQSLRLQKLPAPVQVAFLGGRFFDVDLQYSRNNFGRAVIDAESGEAVIAQAIGEAVATARKTLQPKKFSITQIGREEVERLRELHASSAVLNRQRESHRKRYEGIQTFIDQEFRS